MRQRVVFELDK